MTSRIDRLEKAGLIERRKHPSDRRGVLVALTDAGFALIDGILVEHVANMRRPLVGLDEAEQTQLFDLLGPLPLPLLARQEHGTGQGEELRLRLQTLTGIDQHPQRLAQRCFRIFGLHLGWQLTPAHI